MIHATPIFLPQGSPSLPHFYLRLFSRKDMVKSFPGGERGWGDSVVFIVLSPSKSKAAAATEPSAQVTDVNSRFMDF